MGAEGMDDSTVTSRHLGVPDVTYVKHPLLLMLLLCCCTCRDLLALSLAQSWCRYELGEDGGGWMSSITGYALDSFRTIREASGIDDATFLQSVGIGHMLGALLTGDLGAMSERVSEGKSGAMFFHTHDGNFFVKTINHAEVILVVLLVVVLVVVLVVLLVVVLVGLVVLVLVLMLSLLLRRAAWRECAMHTQTT